LYIEQLSAELKVMTEAATKKLTELRLVQNERVNKNRVERKFQVNDIVFILDRTMVEGNPRVLRTTLNPSPYVVLRPLFKSTLVMRIADRFTSLYNNDDLKLFQGNSPLFQNLPKEVLRALLYKFADLMEQDFSSITRHDPLLIPKSIELFEPDAPKEQNDTDEGVINLFGNEPKTKLDSAVPIVEADRDIEDSDPNTTPPAQAALEEQEFQELPEEEEGIDDDIEELLGQPGESNINQPEDEVSDNDITEEEEEDEEPGMRLRSGTRKQETAPKTVRFR
jgi:hypothetical protein